MEKQEIIKSEEARAYWFEQFKAKYLNPQTVSRVEVINHNSIDDSHTLGRIFTHYDVKSCELSFQDNMQTLKIFI